MDKPHLWVKVSRDKYELPEIVTDTAGEMSRLTGYSTDSIYSFWSKYKLGKVATPSFICVTLEND